MAVTITKNGHTTFLVGTSKTEILQAIVSNHYPHPVAMFYETSSGIYHILADDRP